MNPVICFFNVAVDLPPASRTSRPLRKTGWYYNNRKHRYEEWQFGVIVGWVTGEVWEDYARYYLNRPPVQPSSPFISWSRDWSA